MNDSMNMLVVMGAIAILNSDGAAKAVAHMTKHGMSTNEAFMVIEAYENLRDAVKDGKLP